MKRKPANLPALCLLAAALAPAAVSARSSDRNQPTDIDADSSNCSVSNDAAPCVMSGNVKLALSHVVTGAVDRDEVAGAKTI